MNKLIFFLVLVILASCNQPATQNSDGATAAGTAKPIDTLQSIIDANIHKQPVIDTTFLGFAFSMTKAQAIAHYQQLVKSKVLVMNDADHRLEYPMTFDMAKANATIAPEFNDDKLYKLSLIITPAEEIATSETIFLQAATAYMKKYDGNSYTLFRGTDPVDSSAKQFHWIKNNLQIFLRKTVDGTLVSYINMPVDQLMEKNKKSESDSSKAQTKKDI